MGFIYSFYLTIYYLLKASIELIKNSLGMRTKFYNKINANGKVVIITGANCGLGKQCAYDLSMYGAKVIIGCRDLTKANETVREFKFLNSNAEIVVHKLDLSSFKSIRDFVKTITENETKIDILINNAGVMMCPQSTTEDGFETHFGVNYLGHFLLTLTLLPLLKKSQNGRVVNISSILHILGEINFENINLRNNYNSIYAYSQSKLAQILFAQELCRRLGPNSSVTTYSVHPGFIRTNIIRHVKIYKFFDIFMKFFFIDLEMGSQTALYCALENSIENDSGFYYANCKRISSKDMISIATSDSSALRLWEMSCELVQLEEHLKLNN